MIYIKGISIEPFVIVIVFETMSHYVPLSILELIGIHLPLPPEVLGLKGCSITPGFFK